MKKSILFALLLSLVAFIPVKAQYYFTSDTFYVSGTTTNNTTDNEVDGYNFFHNNSADTITFSWKLISDSIPSAWTLGICDNRQCYYDFTNSFVSLPVAPGIDTANNFLKTAFNPNCVSGKSILRIAVRIVGTLAPPDTLTYIANITTDCSATAVNDLSAGTNPMQIFPNPTNGNIALQGLVANNHTLNIDVLDVQGQLLQSVTAINDGKLSVSCGNLPAGIYLLRVSDLQQHSVSVGRFCRL